MFEPTNFDDISLCNTLHKITLLTYHTRLYYVHAIKKPSSGGLFKYHNVIVLEVEVHPGTEDINRGIVGTNQSCI